MAIITAPEPRQGFGGQVGSSLGEALQYLAQNRLAKMQRQQQAEELSPSLQALIPGLNPEQALGLGLMDPSVQREIIKRKLIQPTNEANAEFLQNFLMQLSGQTPQTQIPTEEGQISNLKIPSGISSQDLSKDIDLILKTKTLKAQEEMAKRKETLAEEKFEHQKATEKLKPFIKEIEEEHKVHYPTAQTIYNLTNNLLDAEATGEVPEGMKGVAAGLLPLGTPGISSVARQYVANSNALTTAVASALKGGIRSKYIAQMVERSKPNIRMDRKARTKIAEEIQEQSIPIIAFEQARKKIQDEYGGYPENAPQLVNKETKKIEHKLKKELKRKVKEALLGESLPDVNQFKEGQKIKNEKGVRYQKLNNKWVRI